MASFKNVGKKNWSFRFKYKDKLTGEWKEVKRRGYPSKGEAELAYEEIKRTIEEGYKISEKTLLVDFIEYWLEQYQLNRVEENTYKLHENNLKNHIKPYFQSLKLGDLTPELYQKFMNHLKAKNYSKRTMEIVHGTVYGAMKRALINKRLKENPAENVIITSLKGKRTLDANSDQLKFLPTNKISDFLNAAMRDNIIYYMVFRTFLETGVRKGEGLALTKDDLLLDENIILVNKTLNYHPDSPEKTFKITKTSGSVRSIPITNSLKLELQSHLLRLEDNKRRFGNKYQHNLNLVFCREDGSPIPRSTLFNAFRRILKSIGMENLPIHSLRHTHAVLLLESKAEMKDIQMRLGHSSMQITSDVYAHTSEIIRKDTIDKFESYTKDIFSGANMGQEHNRISNVVSLPQK